MNPMIIQSNLGPTAALLCFLFTGSSASVAGELPDRPAPSPTNTFHILPIWNDLMRTQTTPEEIRRETDKMLAQFGRGNRYHQVGFSFIYPAGQPEVVRRVCAVAREKGIKIGLIIALQTHANPGLERDLAADARNFQWRSDGENWQPPKDPKSKEPADREDNRLCSSRYGDAVRAKIEAAARQQAKEILGVMREFPGVIAVVNPIIEEGLTGGVKTNATEYYTDCSPFAVTEFRDWLRHTGRYDADKGKYAGQGAPEEIIGPLVKIKGKVRSQFYDDPTPTNAHGTGQSFNQVMGTTFTTWTLRYYDLIESPKPITDRKTNLLPTRGRAFVRGGFDVPRARDNNTPFWKAWNWVNQDQKGYPAGNPRRPAFGFRQWQVRNFVNDFFGWLLAEGLPRELLYAHQVPCEALGDSPMAFKQARTMAQTVWSGFVPACGTVGVTRFGPIEPKLLTQYAPAWGIFEWHPAPGTAPSDQRLYDRAMTDLTNYSTNGCHYLFPGWWMANGEHLKTFPLNDSKFADAIHDFLASRPDRPPEPGVAAVSNPISVSPQ